MKTIDFVTKALHIILYLRASDIGYTPEYIIKTFMMWRYEKMSKECPHKTFSVQQAQLDFFDKAYAHICGIEPLPENKEKSIYLQNYIDWIKIAQKERNESKKELDSVITIDSIDSL